ncbi:MAG: hypothetical protein H6739_32855 [Alphaproteobacteria bacterium]|nr:hypothetical protein [Alphaproteobacteria bacterium]
MDADTCIECDTPFQPGEARHNVDAGVLCDPCYRNLRAQLEAIVAHQSKGLNLPMSTLGGLLGGAAGVLVWWGFTVATEVAFGLVAVVIGYAVGHGVLRLGGHKRAQSLQILSVVIAVVSYAVATYLVNRSFINKVLIERGSDTLPLIVPPELMSEILMTGASAMDLVFLGIVIFEAWRIPAPLRLK